ncbi:2Fe-2S iron-sulfur cluster-binding protein [Nocardioides cheoyonin]|uniref:2Fe-2S iron-sulfur cluster-binding protein n=1 Tax=Nocardioides cheoyonin TaxID=3156615 RepID=UPI0032B3E68A
MRLPGGGRIDRSRTLRFTVDGEPYEAYAGDTVASALLAAGRVRVGDSIYLGRPRGIFSAGVEEPNALIRVDGGDGAALATTTYVTDGMSVSLLSGLGVLTEGEEGVHDKYFAHADVLVVGAGPAGLAAALVAGRSGARVTLVDDQPEPGGSLLGAGGDEIEGMAALDWVGIVAAELDALPEVTVLRRTPAFGSYDHNYVLALEQRDGGTRIHHVRAKQVVLATGAVERPLVFPGNDAPGVMLASAVRTYLHRWAVVPGERVTVLSNNSSTDPLVVELRAAGIEVEVAEEPRAVGPGEILAVSGGWNPVTQLWTGRQGGTRWDEGLATFVPDGTVTGQQIVGAANGAFDLDRCLWEGARAGAAAASTAGFPVEAPTFRADSRAAASYEISPVWLLAEEDAYAEAFVDLQRDQTVADVAKALGAGMTSVEHVKRYTSVGTGGDQGKTSGLVTAGVVAALSGREVAEIGVSSQRPPYVPVSFGALAGRERGELFDPERTTPVHGWHEEHGAAFEIVGQWLRPWYYPQPLPDGTLETMDEAVARECRAARTGVAMQDASTLGKIEIRGRDAGVFLDRIYTNGFSKLKVGSARYGVMCKPDGMIFDDGVTLRLADDRYFMTTTTGGAAGVLDWLEEWLQTEWPELDVTCTSVTEQWTTVAVVGPRSREVVAAVAPALDVSKEAFPFMTWRETVLASGVPARICRISFSGELAFEVNVSGRHGRAVWEEIFAAGSELGITPYGTEAMHVLRAEKGFLIVGQDTDGTVTPADAGMDWIVSTTKDFIGKRSFSRPDTSRPDRKHLVGILPPERLVEGTQLVAARADLTPPVPMLGWVTSSYHSATLDRPFGLALVAGGRDLIGSSVAAVVGDRLVEVEVTSPVFYDPEGARRDG